MVRGWGHKVSSGIVPPAGFHEHGLGSQLAGSGGQGLCEVRHLPSRVWGAVTEKNVGPTFKVKSKGSRAPVPTGTPRLKGHPRQRSVPRSPRRTG